MPARPYDYLVALDPGTEVAGIGCFEGEKLACGFPIKDKSGRKITERAYQMASLLYDALFKAYPVIWKYPRRTKIVIEYPRVIKHGPASRAPPDDILALVLVCGGFGALMCNAGFEIPGMVRPAEWKGQMKKKIMTQLILDYLSPAERALLGPKPDHNAVDGVGLGLDELGRLPVAGEVRRGWHS